MNPHRRVLRILVAVEYDNFRDAELGSGPYSRDHLAAQLRVRREQSERYEAMGLAAAHRLREIEGSVVAPSREPFEASLDQPFQAVGEMVAAEKLTAVDPAMREVLDLRHLFDQAVARNSWAWPTKYIYGLDGHVNPDS
jgi:hypothetical protein